MTLAVRAITRSQHAIRERFTNPITTVHNHASIRIAVPHFGPDAVPHIPAEPSRDDCWVVAVKSAFTATSLRWKGRDPCSCLMPGLG